MNIPRSWTKASAKARTRDGRDVAVSIWGWGDDEGTARRFLETVGTGRPAEFAGKLLELHDRLTRSTESLPLA
jgi:hypothetical protein